jgi:hypothetical protein
MRARRMSSDPVPKVGPIPIIRDSKSRASQVCPVIEHPRIASIQDIILQALIITDSPPTSNDAYDIQADHSANPSANWE